MSSLAVDMDQLNRYTGGDTALNAEILKLFRDQTSGLLAGLPNILGGGDGRAWYEVMHTLKGAARSIGAFGMADAAAAAEKLKPGDEPDKAGAALILLQDQAGAVTSFIDTHLS